MTNSHTIATQAIKAGQDKDSLTKWQTRAKAESLVKRIAAADPSVWASDKATQTAVANRLGWLHVASDMRGKISELEQFSTQVLNDGIRDVVLLGMGGSSLCPSVFGRMFPRPAGHGKFLVLDLTAPAAVQRIESQVDLSRCLFVSASKSGKTVETRSHTEYFWEKVTKIAGANAGARFVAITDQGSALESLGRSRNFRRVFLNPADIGGRYSALSYFGLVPGVLAGVPLEPLLTNAVAAQEGGLGADWPNPAIDLGLLIGSAAKAGRDKLTFMADQAVAPLIPWIEQLIAESTGKHGTGIVPIENEPPEEASHYGSDRMFVFFRLRGQPDPFGQLRAQLSVAGHPIVEITLDDITQIGGEFFRWELATAVAGWVLGINPFDEPNVQESKDNTERVLGELVPRGPEAVSKAVAVADGLAILAVSPQSASSERATPSAILKAWVEQARKCGYVSILAYMDDTAEAEDEIQGIRRILGRLTGRATLRGYGPRYLHSIGQLYKGGPPAGAFLLLSAEESVDLPITGVKYSFSMLKLAQALGDAESLQKRGRPLVHVRVSEPAGQQLSRIAAIFESVA
jgi:transaldolase/glucose-6-phosphate isomerase